MQRNPPTAGLKLNPIQAKDQRALWSQLTRPTEEMPKISRSSRPSHPLTRLTLMTSTTSIPPMTRTLHKFNAYQSLLVTPLTVICLLVMLLTAVSPYLASSVNTTLPVVQPSEVAFIEARKGRWKKKKKKKRKKKK